MSLSDGSGNVTGLKFENLTRTQSRNHVAQFKAPYYHSDNDKNILQRQLRTRQVRNVPL